MADTYETLEAVPTEEQILRMRKVEWAAVYDKLVRSQYNHSKGSAIRTTCNGRMWFIAYTHMIGRK